MGFSNRPMEFTTDFQPSDPTDDDILMAVDTILDAAKGFDLSNEPAFFKALFTAVIRETIDGPTPLFLIRGDAGVGKTTLARMVAMCARGQSQLNSSSDVESVLTAALTAHPGRCQALLFDDVASDFGHDSAVIRAISVRIWYFHEKSSGAVGEVPIRVTWLATVDTRRAKVPPELYRRAIFINLDRPASTLQGGFDPLFHFATKKDAIRRAVVTIMRGWHVAGRPQAAATGLPGFEEWSAVVPQAVAWVEEKL